MKLIYLMPLLLVGCSTGYVNPYLDGYSSYSGGNTTPTATQSSYQDGQKDGCLSGQAALSSLGKQMQKNQDRYMSDANYKSGWDEQFTVCMARQQQLNRNIDDAIQRSLW